MMYSTQASQSTTIASPIMAPFLVPPKLRTSTPASRVNAPRAARNHDMPIKNAINGMKINGSSNTVTGSSPITASWNSSITPIEISV